MLCPNHTTTINVGDGGSPNPICGQKSDSSFVQNYYQDQLRLFSR